MLLGFRVRLTRSAWRTIYESKHPIMAGRERDLEQTLRNPTEIRQSKADPEVYLFYRAERPGRWLCVVAKRLNGDGFVITAYPTDAIKIGESVWTK